MFEKVNPCHPDKMADRLAGAIVDMAYAKSDNPKIAVEVLAGHGLVTVMIETSLSEEQLNRAAIDNTIMRIFDIKDVAEKPIMTMVKIVQQDAHLAENQAGQVRCGDNGIFKGVPPTHEQKLLTAIAASIYERWPYDGKYIIGQELDTRLDEHCKPYYEAEPMITICQSHATERELNEFWEEEISAILYHDDSQHYEDPDYVDYWQGAITHINPLGPWTGGIDVDCGATNRKLGSDMGDGVTGGGLHGKDLSKADVSVNILCHVLAQTNGQTVSACCAIGDTEIMFVCADGGRITLSYDEVVTRARHYITDLGGFEKFAEWGLVRP